MEKKRGQERKTNELPALKSKSKICVVSGLTFYMKWVNDHYLSIKQLMLDKWGISKSHFEPLKSFRTSARPNQNKLILTVKFSPYMQQHGKLTWRVRSQGMENSVFIQAKREKTTMAQRIWNKGRTTQIANSSHREKNLTSTGFEKSYFKIVWDVSNLGQTKQFSPQI